jgi:hypothetical protein
VFGALDVVDATGLTAAPVTRVDLRVGDEVELVTSHSNEPTIAVGQPAAIALLRRAPSGRYVVERIVTVE